MKKLEHHLSYEAQKERERKVVDPKEWDIEVYDPHQPKLSLSDLSADQQEYIKAANNQSLFNIMKLAKKGVRLAHIPDTYLEKFLKPKAKEVISGVERNVERAKNQVKKGEAIKQHIKLTDLRPDLQAYIHASNNRSISELKRLAKQGIRLAEIPKAYRNKFLQGGLKMINIIEKGVDRSYSAPEYIDNSLDLDGSKENDREKGFDMGL